ncbi:hypothetical protein BASA84_001189 [Batrachochytrium salamandrivorans]|nr:hypothetical protein BASA84_001189 [Batrachochytrium salamandrivorans]
MELDWSESLAVTLAVVVDHRDPNKQIASESSIPQHYIHINTTSLLSNWIGSQSINQPHQFTDTDKLVALNISRGPNNRLLESIMDGIALQNIQVHQFRHLYLLLIKKSPAFGSLNLLQILVLSGARKLVQALLRLGPLLDYRATGSFVPSIKSATALWFSIRANHISIAIDLVDAGAEFSFELVTDFVVNYFIASVTVCTHDTRKDISLLEYALIVHAPAETIVALIKISSRVPMPCFVDWVHTQLSVLSSTKESSVDVLSSRISCLEALASVIGSLSEVMVKDFEVLISPGWNHSLSEALRLCPVDSPAYMLLCSDKRSLIPRDRSLMLGLENHNIMRELEVALSKSDISVLSRLVADHPDLCSTYTSIGRSLIHQFSLLASVSLRSSIDFVQQFVSLLLNSTEIDTQSVLNRPDAAMYTPLSFSLLVDSVQETTNAVWGMLADPWIAPTQSELPVGTHTVPS